MISQTQNCFCDRRHRGEIELDGERNLQTSEPGYIEHLLTGQNDWSGRATVHGNGVGHEQESEET
jgi:hypothetical protein